MSVDLVTRAVLPFALVASEPARLRFMEFFTVQIRNLNYR